MWTHVIGGAVPPKLRSTETWIITGLLRLEKQKEKKSDVWLELDYPRLDFELDFLSKNDFELNSFITN